jgi:hypothetical protein
MTGSAQRTSIVRPVATTASALNWSIAVSDVSVATAVASSAVVDALAVTATMSITIDRVRLDHTSLAPYTAPLTASSLAVLVAQTSASVTLRNTAVNIRRRRVTIADGGGAPNADSVSAGLVLIGSPAAGPPQTQVTLEASSVFAEVHHGYADIDGGEYVVRVRATGVAISGRVPPSSVTLSGVEVRSFANLTSPRRAKTMAGADSSLVDLMSAASIEGRLVTTAFNASVSAIVQDDPGQPPRSGSDRLLGYKSETAEARSAVMLFAAGIKAAAAQPNAMFGNFSCTNTDGLRKPHQQRAQLDPLVASNIIFPDNEACPMSGTATATLAATVSGLTLTASATSSLSTTPTASPSPRTLSPSHPTVSSSRSRTATVWSRSRTHPTASVSPSIRTRTPSPAETPSAQRTPSVSLPLPAQVQPVEVPDAVEAIETTNAAAAVTTSAMAASPATAVQAARTGVLLRAQYCNTQVDLPPAFYDSPTAASIVVDDSDRVLRFQVGAAVANPLLLLGCVALHAAVALVHWLVSGRGATKDRDQGGTGDEAVKKDVPVMEPEHVGTYAGSLTWARFPSVLVFPGLFLLQPTVSAIVTVIAHGASGATVATVIAPAIVVLLALAGLAHVTLVGAGTRGVYVVEQFDEYAATGKATPIVIQAFDYVFAGQGRWSDPATDKATGWTRRFFGLFGDYTGKAKWFLLVEGFVCVALGVCAGLLPFSNCKAMNWFLFAFFAAFLGVVLAVRPQDARFDLWVSVLLTTSQLIASAMNVFGASEDVRGSVEGVLAFAMMANLLQGIAKVVAVAFKTLRRGKRREARALLAAKKGGAGGSDGDRPMPGGSAGAMLDQGALQAALLSAAREDEARITAEAERSAAVTAATEAAAQHQRRHVDAPDWGTDGPYVGHREGAGDDDEYHHGGHDNALDDIAALLDRPLAMTGGATGGREGVRRIEAFDVGRGNAYDGLAGGYSSPAPHNYDGDTDDDDEATAAAHAADEAINAPLRLMSSVANAATSVLGAVPINAPSSYADPENDDGLDVLLSEHNKPTASARPAKEETQSSAPSFDDDDLDLL